MTAKRFEFFVAARYLRAKRKQAVISIITVISVIGVAAGVMALVIAIAINNGFRNTLQSNLLGATAHVMLLEKEPGDGIENWAELIRNFASFPMSLACRRRCTSPVFLQRPDESHGRGVKGIDAGRSAAICCSI